MMFACVCACVCVHVCLHVCACVNGSSRASPMDCIREREEAHALENMAQQVEKNLGLATVTSCSCRNLSRPTVFI